MELQLILTMERSLTSASVVMFFWILGPSGRPMRAPIIPAVVKALKRSSLLSFSDSPSVVSMAAAAVHRPVTAMFVPHPGWMASFRSPFFSRAWASSAAFCTSCSSAFPMIQ